MLEELRELKRIQEGQVERVIMEVKGDLRIRVILLEEISWPQKSKALWLKNGDQSTKFFHGVANSHRRTTCGIEAPVI